MELLRIPNNRVEADSFAELDRRLEWERDQAADEIEELREIVSKLPKTADGVPVVPGKTELHAWCEVCDPPEGSLSPHELTENGNNSNDGA